MLHDNLRAVPKRILVVDDNPAIRGALRRILEFNDQWTVCGEAVDGRDGVEKAEQLRPDLVVEAAYEHLQGNRLRHTARFRRFRPDRDPRSCTYDQMDVAVPSLLSEVFGASG